VVVLIILFTCWLAFRSIGALGVGALATWQHSARYALVVMLVFTGIAHFNKMNHDLARMVPAMFPRPLLLVYFTGLLEFMGVGGLLLRGSLCLGNLSDRVIDRHISRQCERRR
jgi:hypothetical protein